MTSPSYASRGRSGTAAGSAVGRRSTSAAAPPGTGASGADGGGCPHVDAFSVLGLRRAMEGKEETRSFGRGAASPRAEGAGGRHACESCGTADHPWACLGCGAVRCGRFAQGHALEHGKLNGHAVAVDVREGRLWCYRCDADVLETFDEAAGRGALSPQFAMQRKHAEALAQEAANVASALRGGAGDEGGGGASDGEDVSMSPREGRRTSSDDGMAVDGVPARRGASSGEGSAETVVGAALLGLSRRGGKCGIKNIGNTCYLASALQALLRCPTILYYFVHFRKAADATLAMHRGRAGAAAKGQMVTAFANIVQDSWGAPEQRGAAGGPLDGTSASALPGRSAAMSPNLVLKELSELNSSFRGYQQADAQEAIRTLLDTMHDALKHEVPDRIKSLLSPSSRGAAGQPPSPRESSASPRRSLSLDGHNFVKRKPLHRSVISDSFMGTFMSEVKCFGCRAVSCTEDSFFDLSVEIPNQRQQRENARRREEGGGGGSGWWNWAGFGGSGAGSGGTLGGGDVHIVDCLDHFCQPELLSGSDKYKCEKCKTFNDCEKRLTVCRAPQVLCLHLKRFSFDSYFGSKVSTKVRFPMAGLEMAPFLYQGVGGSAKEQGKSALYDLVSVVNHHGSIRGGHYTAYGRRLDDTQWYLYDDASVSPVQESTVAASEAYMLFYVQRASESLTRERREVEDARTALTASTARMQRAAVTRLVSAGWYTRFMSVNNPGPMDASDVACPHMLAHKRSEDEILQLTVRLPEDVATNLHRKYGGDPPLVDVPGAARECLECKKEERALEQRRVFEKHVVNSADTQTSQDGEAWFLISAAWLEAWKKFIKGDPLPGPVDNTTLLKDDRKPKQKLVRAQHYRGINPRIWAFFKKHHGGGPPLPRRELDIYDTAIPSQECREILEKAHTDLQPLLLQAEQETRSLR